MLDPFVGHLCGVKLGEATVETRISVNYLEIIHRDDLDLIVRGDVRKPHILSIPLQLTMQTLQSGEANGQDSHHDHLVERTGELEVG